MSLMLCDAHVHVGYYSRIGRDEPYYYSPRRILGVLKRFGVNEFIVSSTCAQVSGIGVKDIVREAQEVKRTAVGRVHIFFWLSGRLYEEDPLMHWLESGVFSGFKLHEDETPWIRKRRNDLYSILSVAAERNMPVMFHSGENDGSSPKELARIADKFPSLRFCFAHCRPMDEMAKVVETCSNVWTDTAYMSIEDFPRLLNYDWHGRLMFGTDLPAWQAYERVGLDRRYSEYIEAVRNAGLERDTCEAFKRFTATNKKGNWHGSD